MRCFNTYLDYRRQVAFAFVVAGCMMVEGIFFSWPNVIVDLIQANNDNRTANASYLSHPQLLLTDYEAGWLASLTTISSIPVVLLSGLVINLVGLKGSSMLGLVLTIVALLLKGLASSKTALFIGRAISGAAHAFIVTVSQPLVSELVSPKIRGVTASLPRFFSTLGVLEINVADIFLPWYLTTALSAIPFAVFLFFMIFVPESPYWLVKKGRHDAALSALKSLNPSADNIEEHFQEVKNCVALSSKKEGLKEQMRQMSRSKNYKPVMLMVTIHACYGANGCSIILPYSTLLFTQAGIPLDPRLCTILLGVVRLVTVILGAFAIDFCGRRPLYIGSSILGVLFLVSTFVSLTFPFIPKVFVVIFIMCLVFVLWGGASLVPSILLGEIIPSAVQSVGCSLCILLDTLTFSAFLFATPWLTRAIPLRFVFLFPAVINLMGAFVAWRWLPETKGRPLIELQQAFV